MSQLVRETGVTPAAAYHYFKDKSALLLDVAAAVHGTWLVAIGELADLNLPLDELLGPFVEAHLKFVQSHPRHYALAFSPEYARHKQLAPRIEKTLALLSALMSGRMDRVPSDPELYTFWALVHGAASLAVAGHPPDLPQLIQACEGYLEGLREAQ